MVATLALAGLILGPIPAAQGISNRLTVNVNGLKANRGRICYSLFSSSAGFPTSSQRAIRAECIPVSASSSAIAFGDLSPGTYAVAVFHDKNSDGQLNKNSFGMPTEGFGFSQNPGISTGPPKFRDAAIFVAVSTSKVSIQLNHLF
ncbi:MAG: DUF2141 domain-containing protein [Cyanobacteria bacterium P01_F01_bin.42]